VTQVARVETLVEAAIKVLETLHRLVGCQMLGPASTTLAD
jgi:hypothetical protein